MEKKKSINYIMVNNINRIYVYIIFIMLFGSVMYAQNDIINAELKVTVTNEKNRKPNNAFITKKSKDSSYTESARTNISGMHKFNLRPVKYSLKVTIEEFIPYEENEITLKKNERKSINAVLTYKIYTTDEIDVEGVFKQSQNGLRKSRKT